MQNTIRTFVAGVVIIGVITALVLPGRQSAQVATSIFNGSSNLLGTAIKG